MEKTFLAGPNLQEIGATSVLLIQHTDGKEGRDDPSANDVQVIKTEEYADHPTPLFQPALPIAEHEISPIGRVRHALWEDVEWAQSILILRPEVVDLVGKFLGHGFAQEGCHQEVLHG